MKLRKEREKLNISEMNLKNALFWTPLSLAGKLQLILITNYGESNESKKIFTSQ